jgi:acyl carrier protein
MVPDADKTIFEVIRMLLARRDAGDIEIAPSSHLTQDLDLDSLELAELSAALEDDLGRDPYTEGIVPNTVGDLIGFYAD